MVRVGFSKDIHRLVPNRKLILGGVVVPYSLGEQAHSDGDVLYHALGEAILGALALGDLGSHFPDNDPSSENMDSSLIVKHIYELMRKEGCHINNVDIFISLEKPKLKDYINAMRDNVARLLEVDVKYISIKAGTNEKCGEVGRGEAVEAYAIVSVEND
mgnify:CR=1 FL=1